MANYCAMMAFGKVRAGKEGAEQLTLFGDGKKKK
jgi:hypothetical protein